MKLKSIALIIVLIAIVGLVLSLIWHLVTGVVSGLFQLVLGVFVVVALIAIVFWMFAYAKNHRK